MRDPLQKTLPYDPFAVRPLPGIRPLDMADWLIADEAFAGQMAQRARLLDARRNDVLALDEGARAAADELLGLVLHQNFGGTDDAVARRDGAVIAIDRNDPLGTLGRLVQEDFCILQKHGDRHVLAGAVLCFPASWTLEQKFMRPLDVIHRPVIGYDADIAARVQRLFDGVQAGRPLWRFNALWYGDAALYQPRREGETRPRVSPETAGYLRSERQSILRLPVSGAVVFSIHTYVLRREDALATRST